MTFADDGDDQEIIDVRYVLQFVLIVVVVVTVDVGFVVVAVVLNAVYNDVDLITDRRALQLKVHLSNNF